MANNTFWAANAQNIPELRRAVNDGLDSVVGQFNRELQRKRDFYEVISVATFPSNPLTGDEMWINTTSNLVVDTVTYTAGSVYKRLGTTWVDTGVTSI